MSEQTTLTVQDLAALLSDHRQKLDDLHGLTLEFAALLERLNQSTLAVAGEVGPNLNDPERSSRVPALSSTADAVVELSCLGSFIVRIDGQLIDLSGASKPATILKILAGRGGRPTSRDQLVEQLWPEVDPSVGANRLRSAIHALRELIGEPRDLIRYEQGQYRLNARVIRIDADEFESLVARSREYERDGRDEDARAALEQAVSLYRGAYFDAETWSEALVVRRQTLADQYVNALLRLAPAAFERADYERCVTYAMAIVNEDDCCEDAYRILMLAHARLGNRGRALRWFDVCEQRLDRELGISPSRITRTLRDRVLNDLERDGMHAAAPIALRDSA